MMLALIIFYYCFDVIYLVLFLIIKWTQECIGARVKIRIKIRSTIEIKMESKLEQRICQTCLEQATTRVKCQL